MAHIREVMAAGVPASLARMLGQNRLRTVAAAGSTADDATPLVSNFVLVTTTGANGGSAPLQGIRLNQAVGAALTAVYNVGPGGVMIYPAEDEAFNDLGPDLPILLPVGDGMLAVPAVNHWLAIAAPGDSGAIGEAPITGQLFGRQSGLWMPVPPPGIYDAPGDGAVYARQSGVWVAVPPPGSPPPNVAIDAGGGAPIAIMPGIGRVYVTTTDSTILVLPLNDCLVIDRSGDRTNPIVVQTPVGPPQPVINGSLTALAIVNPWDSRNFIYDGANFGA